MGCAGDARIRLEVINARDRRYLAAFDGALFEKKRNVLDLTARRRKQSERNGRDSQDYAPLRDRYGNPPFHHVPSPRCDVLYSLRQ